MTCGIYRLVFSGTDKYYIGQSINIERRYKAHLNSFINRKANPKMLAVYDLYGQPELEILCECLPKELNGYEAEAIEIFNAVDNGLNIFYSAHDVPIYYGEEHPRCKYTNEQISKAAELLVDPNNTAKYICSQTGLSIDAVNHLASLKSYAWLKQDMPELYDKLVVLKGTRKNPKDLEKRGIKYPPVISPDGTVYSNITNLKRFCEEHGLYRSNFRRVLKGTSKVCLGWRLANG